MIQSLNFPLTKDSILPFGGWDSLGELLSSLGLDGVEGIADPEYFDDAFPSSLLTGYHMTFYPDWVDFWRQDKAALLRKFGSMETVRGFYRCGDPDGYLRLFRDDLSLALSLGARYLVFHVSDVSLEEGYTYRFEHTNREVLDASIELINALLEGITPTFEFLVENQWWPGFTFTDPAETEYLLSRIRYPRVGIMLDTGHLMNTSWKLRTQKQGVEYILNCFREHGEIGRRVRGLHFHQSLSGAYCRKAVGRVPDGFPSSDYYRDFGESYGHILRIDRHRPWTDPSCARILEAVQPSYLTHELSTLSRMSRIAALKLQLRAIERGRTLSDPS